MARDDTALDETAEPAGAVEDTPGDPDTTPQSESETADAEIVVPKTRKKVSGVELEGRFDQWRQERRDAREQRDPEQTARRNRRSVIAVLCVAILAAVVASGMLTDSFGSQRAENTKTIDTLEGQIVDEKADPTDPDLADKLTALTTAAAKDGGSVRDLQQQYADLFYAANTDPVSGDGTPSAAEIKIVEHRRELAPYFDPDSFQVEDDAEAYSTSSVVPFDTATEIDPRFPWYIRYDGLNASPPSDSTWELTTVTPDLERLDTAGKADQANVTWLCKDEKGRVLAWATARYVYDGKDGVFDELRVVVSGLGAEHVATPEDEDE